MLAIAGGGAQARRRGGGDSQLLLTPCTIACSSANRTRYERGTCAKIWNFLYAPWCLQPRLHELAPAWPAGYRDATMVFAWTRGFFWVAVLMCGLSLVLQQMVTPDGWIWLTLRIGILAIAISRAMKRLSHLPMMHANGWRDSVQPAYISGSSHRFRYSELCGNRIAFSLIACNLPPEMYNPPVYGDILSAIYSAARPYRHWVMEIFIRPLVVTIFRDL